MISQHLLNAQAALLAARQRSGVSYRPPTCSHANTLGEVSIAEQLMAMMQVMPSPVPVEETRPASRVIVRDTVNHHPDVGIAALSANESSHYQLWLLLRLMDATGQGHVDQEWAALHLTGSASKWKQYKRPRLRQLLAEGNGRYWETDTTRIWLRKTVNVAASLGISRLNGRFTTGGIDDIRGSIAPFRAYLYSTWLGNHRNPMSRATIERLTGISASTQQRYSELADITTTENLAMGPRLTAGSSQEAYWRHDGVFEFIDHDGRQGPPHRRYIAWHLPSSYTSPTPALGRSQTRHANKQLAVLVNITGAPGNGQLFAREHITRRFHANGKRAALAARRTETGNDMYWKLSQARTGRGLWQQLEAVSQ
jgi:hypothetical protein